MKKLLLPFLLTCVFGCPAVELVRDGQPVAEIAIPAAAVSSVQFAAQELRDHIRMITGAELPLVKADAPRRLPNRVHLGYGVPPQDSGAFAGHIRAAGPDLFLHGNDREIPENNLRTPRGKLIGWGVISSGTLISVYDFLDRELQVRFRRPGPGGTYVKPRKNLSLPDFERPVQFVQAAALLDQAERIADTGQARREIAFLKLGLEHARLTLLMGQAHLARVQNDSPGNQRDFQQKYRILQNFRKTHENSGISWMSILNSFENYNFYCSFRYRNK